MKNLLQDGTRLAPAIIMAPAVAACVIYGLLVLILN